MCVCERERGVSDERGSADSDALLNTDERKASGILIRLLSLFPAHPSE